MIKENKKTTKKVKDTRKQKSDPPVMSDPFDNPGSTAFEPIEENRTFVTPGQRRVGRKELEVRADDQFLAEFFTVCRKMILKRRRPPKNWEEVFFQPKDQANAELSWLGSADSLSLFVGSDATAKHIALPRTDTFTAPFPLPPEYFSGQDGPRRIRLIQDALRLGKVPALLKESDRFVKAADEILRGVRKGDFEAFGRLLARLGPRLLHNKEILDYLCALWVMRLNDKGARDVFTQIAKRWGITGEGRKRRKAGSKTEQATERQQKHRLKKKTKKVSQE